MEFYRSMRDFALFFTPLLWKKQMFLGWGRAKEKNDERMNIPCPLLPEMTAAQPASPWNCRFNLYL